ncbi:alpha/beta hydrolase [Promethearchaeum syntrophicum]|uniref:Alpha/beta hydrolase n=1 Tax=Promethearchaeum syntrophicum TaxID=2594042 RepID=A0A5B9D773_9ARCH|nr:alpha/beta hydrolase [Candidatus Prometheoarchaeum syntrophicum]QEE14690.1 short chain dehydrogenase [Candidatus Prometheoarchaeum syntrophicum]
MKNSIIIRPKHILLFIVDFSLAAYIYYVNFVLFGNDFWRCIYLSVMTFAFTWLCWALYFELRDFWQFRWHRVEPLQIKIKSVQIPILWSKKDQNLDINRNDESNSNENPTLYGEILHKDGTPPKSPVVIFSHGFSDDCIYTRHITIPIALSGYDVLTFDSRGSGKSRKAGKTSQFVEITRDLKDVIKYVKNDSILGDRTIYLVGISLGSLASIKQGLADDSVEKIIAVSAMSNYRNNIPQSPITFKKNWWLWLRYTFFGVKMNPLDEVNYELSPKLQLAQLRRSFNNDADWVDFTSKKLFLVHAKNDKIISFESFLENRDVAKLISENNNWEILNSGGHNFLQYELPLVSTIIAMMQK